MLLGDDDDDDDENDENEQELQLLCASLTENTYSLMYVANPKERAFYVGIVFFLIQNSLPVLTLLNLIDIQNNDDDGNSFLNVPVDLDMTVHIAGYITLILSVPYFPDLLDSIEKFQIGYHKQIVLDQCIYATYQKWYFAYMLQFFSGLLFQFVIFVLVVQSTNVIGMLLNFAALSFITEIDDLAFSLIDRGYFSNAMKRTCDDVKNLKTPAYTKGQGGPWIRRLAAIFFILLLIVPYSIIVAKQKAPTYSCTKIEVQFGDGFWTVAPFYSGIYSVDETKSRKGGRLVYLDEMSNGQTSFFRYCPEYESWVFGLFNKKKTTTDNNNIKYNKKSIDEQLDDICISGRWVSKSPETNTYDMLDERPMDWVTRRIDGRGSGGGGTTYNYNYNDNNVQSYPVDQFQINCLDCNPQSCNVNNGAAGNTCEKKDDSNIEYCKCQNGFLGSRCQYNAAEQACDFIDYDHQYNPFPYPTPSRFDLAKDNKDGNLVEFRGKTVYVNVSPRELYLLIYHGRRYVLLVTTYGNANKRFHNSTEDTIVGDFIGQMKQAMKNGEITPLLEVFMMLMSEPLDDGTPKDQVTPTGISWFLPGTDDQGRPTAEGAPVTTRLVCGTCNPNAEMNCGRSGQCVSSETTTGGSSIGQCVCGENIRANGDGYVGPHCEAYVPNITRWYEDQ